MEREENDDRTVRLEIGGVSSSSSSTTDTLCGCITVKHALVTTSVALLLMAIMGTAGGAILLARYVNILKPEIVIVVASSMALLASAVGIVIFGLFVIHKEHSGFVEAYFWTSSMHWILDLGTTIVLLVFSYKYRDQTGPQICTGNADQAGCLRRLNRRLVFITIGLATYKIVGLYAWYLLFRFRKQLAAIRKNSIGPTLAFLKRSSTSSLSSIFEKKWWSPSQIPTIKIDYASDDSSDSAYSNDSPGYRNVQFPVQYPTLTAPPQALFVSHLNGDAMAPAVPPGLGITVQQPLPREPPGLPSYSVVGSERGVLT